MKRLIKNNLYTQEFIIPTTPIYNPLGNGNLNETSDDPFINSDKKSYQNMINKKHEDKHWKNS